MMSWADKLKSSSSNIKPLSYDEKLKIKEDEIHQKYHHMYVGDKIENLQHLKDQKNKILKQKTDFIQKGIIDEKYHEEDSGQCFDCKQNAYQRFVYNNDITNKRCLECFYDYRIFQINCTYIGCTNVFGKNDEIFLLKY